MPAGRPLKFGRAEKDTNIEYSNISLIKYKTEEELQRFIFDNIDDVMYTVFDEKVKKSELEHRIYNGKRMLNNNLVGRINARIDIYVECNSGNKYILEVKNSRNCEKGTIKAISQLLLYNYLLGDDYKMVVVSPMYEEGWKEIVTKYNLPIDFLLVADNQMFLLKK